MGTKLPFLPVTGRREFELFNRLVMTAPSPINFDDLAVTWCQHVDAVDIFPKLPVYLRTYHATWQKNQLVKDSVHRNSAGLQALKAINTSTSRQMNINHTMSVTSPTTQEPIIKPVTFTPSPVGTLTSTTILSSTPIPHLETSAISAQDTDILSQQSTSPTSLGPLWQKIHDRMMIPSAPTGTLSANLAPSVVGGTFVPTTHEIEFDSAVKRKKGERGQDTKVRSPRTCYTCSSQHCKGVTKRAYCPQYNNNNNNNNNNSSNSTCITTSVNGEGEDNEDREYENDAGKKKKRKKKHSMSSK